MNDNNSKIEEIKNIIFMVKQKKDMLNDWEKKFIKSIDEYFLRYHNLSEKQKNKLRQIFQRTMA